MMFPVASSITSPCPGTLMVSAVGSRLANALKNARMPSTSVWLAWPIRKNVVTPGAPGQFCQATLMRLRLGIVEHPFDFVAAEFGRPLHSNECSYTCQSDESASHELELRRRLRRTGPGRGGVGPGDTSLRVSGFAVAESSPVDNDIGVSPGDAAWLEQIRTATRPTACMAPRSRACLWTAGVRGGCPARRCSALCRPGGGSGGAPGPTTREPASGRPLRPPQRLRLPTSQPRPGRPRGTGVRRWRAPAGLRNVSRIPTPQLVGCCPADASLLRSMTPTGLASR